MRHHIKYVGHPEEPGKIGLFNRTGSNPVLATIVPWCNWITWPASNGLLRVQILLELQTTQSTYLPDIYHNKLHDNGGYFIEIFFYPETFPYFYIKLRNRKIYNKQMKNLFHTVTSLSTSTSSLCDETTCALLRDR